MTSAARIMLTAAAMGVVLSVGAARAADREAGKGVLQFELVDGMVITGRIDAKVIAIRIASGNVLKIPVAALRELTVGLNDRPGFVKRVEMLIESLDSCKTRNRAVEDLRALGPGADSIVKRHADSKIEARRAAVVKILEYYKAWPGDHPDAPETTARPLKARSKIRTDANTFFGTVTARQFRVASFLGPVVIKLEDVLRICPCVRTAARECCRWTVNLRDKTRLRGMVINKSLRVQTRYGTMDVPFVRIRRVVIGADGKGVTVQSWGFDRIVGAIEPGTTISFKTDKGRLDLPAEKIALAACEPITLKGHSKLVNSVAFSPDGKRLASGSYDKTIKLWDTAVGKELPVTFKGRPGGGTDVAFSPDGKRLASAGGEGIIKLWDSVTGKELFTINGHSGLVSSVAFSPDGKRLVSGSYDNTMKLWDTATGKHLLTIGEHPNLIFSVAFSPDGKRLASGGIAAPIKLWDSVTGKELLAFEGDSKNTYSVAFSPDGKRMVSGHVDRTVRLWDTATGKKLLALKGHSCSVLSVAFSPDGKRLASGGNYNNTRGLQYYDGAVRIWDAVTGKELLTLKGHLNSVWSVAFSPDGKRLASAGAAKGSIKLWDLPDRIKPQ